MQERVTPPLLAGGDQPEQPPDWVADTGLVALIAFLGYFDIAISPGTLQREYCVAGQHMTSFEIVSAARASGLKARLTTSKPNRVSKLSLPVIARHKDGSFFMLLKAGEDRVLVKHGMAEPEPWSLAELGVKWSGEVVLLTRRDNPNLAALKFGISWFVPTERVKSIQPLENGAIAKIHVKDGQKVSKGELLVAGHGR